MRKAKSFGREAGCIILANCLAMGWYALIYKDASMLTAVAAFVAMPVACSLGVLGLHKYQTMKQGTV